MVGLTRSFLRVCTGAALAALAAGSLVACSGADEISPPATRTSPTFQPPAHPPVQSLAGRESDRAVGDRTVADPVAETTPKRGMQARGASTRSTPVRGTSSDGALAARGAGSRQPALLGLERVAVKQMLGDPQHARLEPPAEVWQYRNRDCVLLVFFYERDGDGSATRVEHVETLDHAAHRLVPTSGDCLDALISRRARAAAE